jgi:hypothetical protein
VTKRVDARTTLTSCGAEGAVPLVTGPSPAVRVGEGVVSVSTSEGGVTNSSRCESYRAET